MNKSKENTSMLMSIKDASVWASEFLNRDISPSNISYLVQYGRISKMQSEGQTVVDQNELKEYYGNRSRREKNWKDNLGNDVNWTLSFDHLREIDTTKHVHRLHPYKGKFIPQLVEYFLDDHTDSFKHTVYFNRGDVLLDPFGGSGTTLVQCNEMGMHAVGIDISSFNCLISNVKVNKHDLQNLEIAINDISVKFKKFLVDCNVIEFEEAFERELSLTNKKHFPSPEFKTKVQKKQIAEYNHYPKYLNNILTIYRDLVKTFGINLLMTNDGGFLDKWYLPPVKNEIYFLLKEIENVQNPELIKVLKVILSRTIRSCRATTHSDLATLKEPITEPYYCTKHYKICKPLLSILRWWEHYSQDTLKRLETFNKHRSNTFQICLEGDSRSLDITSELGLYHPDLHSIVSQNGFAGIFTSPPYIGLIDYHEQHAYAYDLFKIQRNDEHEIGAMSKGQSKNAKDSYVQDISSVLKNCSRFLKNDANIFVVANDKYNLYPTIAELAGLRLESIFQRPVLNRTERDKAAYSETIFHYKTMR